MAVLHGNWLPAQKSLFLWGEIWRRIPENDVTASLEILPHPYGMTALELDQWLKSLPFSERLGSFFGAQFSPGVQNLVCPIVENHFPQLLPQYSLRSDEESGSDSNPEASSLWPWQVEGICLEPAQSLKFLQSLPLGASDAGDTGVGGDLRFWSHLSRWSLDLLARSKFLPGLELQPDGTSVATWQLLLDSATDQARLDNFASRMPEVCRSYVEATEPLSCPIPADPKAIIQKFINWAIETQVRATIGNAPFPTLTGLRRGSEVEVWLQALGARSPMVKADPGAIGRLDTALKTWTAPLQQYLVGQNSFRVCFKLCPPETGQQEWWLEYALQAIDDPALLIDAVTIWNHPVEQFVYQGRTVLHPQETFLAGLGLASRLYPHIEPSLRNQRPAACALNPLQVYEFAKSVAWRLEDSGFGVILPTGLSNQDGMGSRLGLKIRADAPVPGEKQRLGLQSLLNFKWELSLAGHSLSKREFDRLVALKTPLVEINGEWVELRPQDIRAAQNFFAARKDQMSLSLEDALRISTGDTQVIEKLPVVNFEASGALQQLIETLTGGNRQLQPIEPPTHFRGQLRPYQSRGAGWLTFLEQWGLGACLADDMGLGKTVQTIAFLQHLQEEGHLEQPSLLICPTSVLTNWEREVRKFGPTLKTLVHHGDKRSKGKALTQAVRGIHLVITSYALIYRDIKDLQAVNWRMVILDEAQNVKNPEAKQSQVVRELNTQFRLALTGTPVENRLSELWSIMDFLNPGYLGPRNFFQRRFAVPIERYGDSASLRTLRSLVQPFILRRLKTDRDIIQDLPEKQEMAVFCGLSAEQATLYQTTVETALSQIEESDGIQRHGLILALLTKLKQICNHPAHFLKEKQLGSAQRSGKLQRLQEMLDEVLAENDRALVFTQFAEWGKLLQAYLQQHLGREVMYLYGSTSKQQREEIVDRFQQDPQAPRILILSLKAGGVGLNLTRANHVFHVDRWWNPAVENQATDRAFRIGQTRNVQVHKFVCTGTLEEKIHDLIESKKALAEQVVGAGENWLTELDSDQLRSLLLLDRAAVIDDE